MKRKYVWLSLSILILSGLAVLAGYILTTGKEYSADLNSLRLKFNQDQGKVRLVLLLSPT